MKTISLRYTDNFAPDKGTIVAHQNVLDVKGYVWYGKLGTPISLKIASMLLNNPEPRFLLIHSGAFDRYWIYFDKISREQPIYEDFPDYYHNIADRLKTWFRIIRIEKAEKNVMSKCVVVSSGLPLSDASRHSMSPYFIIEYNKEQ